MKKTAPLTAGLVAVALAGVGVFAGQALSGEKPAPTAVTQVANQSNAHVGAPAEVAAVTTSQAHAAELTEQLAKANVLAGAQLSAATPKAGPLRFYPIGETSVDGYKATAVLTDGKGKSTLSVFVQSAKKPYECKPENNCFIATPAPNPPGVSQPSQATVHRANGSVITVTKSARMLSANAKLADGTVVVATIRNEVETFDGDIPLETVTSRADVPLTEEQIVAVVERPGFHY
jgi:hypothetical protein